MCERIITKFMRLIKKYQQIEIDRISSGFFVLLPSE